MDEDRHGAGLAAKRLIGGIVIPGVNGQIQIVPPLGAEGAVQQAVPGQLVGKGVQGPGADIALQVPHRMESGLADGGIVVIGALSVHHLGEHVPVPVQHRAAGKLAAAVVQVAVEGGGRPAAAVQEVFHQEESQARRQQQRQRQTDKGPPLNFLHGVPPFPCRRGPLSAPPAGGPPGSGAAGACGRWQSWRSPGYLWPSDRLGAPTRTS